MERSAGAPGTLTVRPAFKGTDGRRYILALTADPARPIVNREAAVRAAWVDADTGAPLPGDVSLRDGLPPVLEVSMLAAAGSSTREFSRVDHGVYQGRVTLYTAGSWTVRVSFTGADGTAITFEADTLQGVAP